MKDPLEPLRRSLLEAALIHVPFEGWTTRALDLAAVDCGVEAGRALVAFPGGARDLLVYFLSDADRRAVDELGKHDIAGMRIRDAIARAVRLRLETMAAQREAMRRAVITLSLPSNAGLAFTTLYRTVDSIWIAVGDTSADFNFYTKRGLLAAVYSSTLAYWLADESKDCADTWSFLDRRIADIMSIQKARGRLGRLAGCLPSLARTAGRFRFPGRRFRI